MSKKIMQSKGIKKYFSFGFLFFLIFIFSLTINLADVKVAQAVVKDVIIGTNDPESYVRIYNLANCSSNNALQTTSLGRLFCGAVAGGTGGVTGTGLANYTARWTGASALSYGALYDNGTNIGIGTTTPITSLAIGNNDYKQLALNRNGSNQILWSGSVWDSVGSFTMNNAYYQSSWNYIPNYAFASGIQYLNDGSLRIMADSGLTPGVAYTPTTRLNISVAGNVTIPTGTLTVSGTGNSSIAGTFRNSLATTHSLLAGVSNAVVMTDTTGTLYSGLNVHAARNNEVNKIVRTDVNGYIQAGYINSSDGDQNIASSPPRVWGTNGSDSYLRTYSTSALSVGTAVTATTFTTNNTNYKGTTDNAVAGQLMWKNYGNGHTVFDASNSTSPNGVAVNNTNSAVAWSATYPTLMGWNGSSTYGVRVDSARIANTATALVGNGTNCAAGNYPLGVDASGNAETCTALPGAHNAVTQAIIGAAPNAYGYTLNNQIINLEPASASFGGVVTTGAQTFAGAKTFSSQIVGSISGNAGTATALAGNGTNCTAGNYPLGVDASGNVETCTALPGAHNALTLGAIGAAPNANGATLSTQVFNLEPASASFGGVVTTGAQTFAGAKTFSSQIIGNISGNAATADSLNSTLIVGKGGTGATTLTGVLKGNGSSAFTAMNGVTDSLTKWTDANTLGKSIIFDYGIASGVGINLLATSTAMLDINGSLKTNSSVTFQALSHGGTQIVTVDDNGTLGSTPATGYALPSGTDHQTLRYNALGGWTASSFLWNNGGRVGINTIPSNLCTYGEKFQVGGGMAADAIRFTADNSCLMTPAVIDHNETTGALDFVGSGGFNFTSIVNSKTGFSTNAVAGLTGTVAVRNAANTGSCNLVFSGGILTSETCP